VYLVELHIYTSLIIAFPAFPKLIERYGYPGVSALDVWGNEVKPPPF
jgi:hypothetical protein